MKANYVQRGGALDYKNTTKDMITAGDVLVLGSRIGVAGTDIVPGGLGTVHVDGVYEIAKADKVGMTVGTEVYFSENGITTTIENEITTTTEDGSPTTAENETTTTTEDGSPTTAENETTTTTEDGDTTTVEKKVRAGFVAMDSSKESDTVCVKINA